MDQQDQENFRDESTMVDQQEMDQDVNRQELIKQDETAGSASSNRKILVKIKVPEKVVEPPPPPAEIVRAEENKSHYCKECNKSFSSGKALGGHMSSAHVQANKDYSSKKLKSRMMMMKAQIRDSGSYSGPGQEDNSCAVCGKRFPSQKSLYGHMRCHPDREWRGTEPPVGLRMEEESSEASTEPGLEYTGQNQDHGVDSGPDAVALPLVDFVNFLKAWPVTAKRGRSARPGTVSPPVTKSPPVSSSEEISAGHQLLRLLKRNLDSGEKIGGGEVDQGRPEWDAGVNIKKRVRNDDYPVKKPIVCGTEANHRPGQETVDRDQARDYKRPKLKIWNTNGKIECKGKGKERMDDYNKGKDKADVVGVALSEPEPEHELEPETETEDDLFLSAISVLANGKRETHHYHRPEKPIPDSPIIERKDNSSSPEKYMCSTCKKVFHSHQALGGHRSSHKKFRMNIVNTVDNVNNLQDTKPKAEIVGGVQIDVDDDNLHVCKICNKSFPTGRALGGHNKCHNNSENIIGDDDDNDQEKVVRGFDLNMIPDDENGDL